MDSRILQVFEDETESLLRIAWDVTRHRQDAEDAVSAAAKKLCGVSTADIGNLGAFITRVVRNEALNLVRDRRRSETPSPDLDALPLPRAARAGDDDPDGRPEARRSGDLLREAMSRLSVEHRQVIETLLANDCKPERALDALVKRFGAGRDDRAVRNTQKVRLHAARVRLFLLYRLGKIALGCEKSCNALCQLLLQGDEHYDAVQWGLKRGPQQVYLGRMRLDGLVRLGGWIHCAAQQADDAVDRRRLRDVLRLYEQSLTRLCYKYGSPKVRRNQTVQDYFASQDPECTMESLRNDLCGSHLRVLVRGNQVAGDVLAWAQAKLQAISPRQSSA